MQHITNTGINQFVTTTNHITTTSTDYNNTISCQPWTLTTEYEYTKKLMKHLKNTQVKNIIESNNNIILRQPQVSIITKCEDNKMFNEFIVDYLRSIQRGFCSASFRITKVEMLAKNKVMRFTFDETTFLDKDNKSFIVKTVCKPEDTFSIETACYIAIAKYISRGELTPEGISAFADNLKFYKRANKIVAAAVKLYNKSVKETEKAAAAEKEAKLIKERRRAKKIRYKERRKQKRTN